ncbi:MAG TPA: glycosyltransferase family 4 protein, partial [Spirochaetales bacterium]|nr:glycosyltransferase family 4 protein [Spirochaetales bacterium]
GSPRHGMNYRPYHLARELTALGVDVTVISGSTSHEYYAPPVTNGRYTLEDVDGLRYVWIRTPGYGESRSLGRVKAWAAYLAGLYGIGRVGLPRPDAIIVSSPPPYPIVPAARLARRYGSKLVFEVRDLWPLSLVELGGASPRHPFVMLTQWVEDFAYRRSGLVVCVVAGALEYMRSRGLDPGKFLHIPNGVSVANMPPSATTTRRAFPDRRFIVGYAGKVGIAYGMEALLEAARLLKRRPDIGIAVVGAGTYRDELAARADESGLDNIRFLPPVPKAQVPDVLAGFDACYLGLRPEPLFRYGVSPTKLFDYMAAAKPIVWAIDSGNNPVEEAACGVGAKAGDPASIARAIERLADEPALERKAMGERGRRYLEERHDWAVLGQRYHEALFKGSA